MCSLTVRRTPVSQIDVVHAKPIDRNITLILQQRSMSSTVVHVRFGRALAVQLTQEHNQGSPGPMYERAIASTEALPGDAKGGDLLIDVSRLIWRVWTGRLPTGIDRVCLAYLDRYADQALAVVQKNGWRRVLARADSQVLFALLAKGGSGFRKGLLAMAPGALMRAGVRPPRPGMVYLNIGHTGLEAAGLPLWIARNQVRAVYLVHDLIPITNPEFCREGEAEKHTRRMINALGSASGVIANSRSTLADLERFAAAQRLAMPPGIAAWLAGQAHRPAPRTGAQERAYFVTVGTIEGRKNHILLLRLWRRMIEQMGSSAPRLVIIGQRGWEADHALAMLDRCDALRGHVAELGSCEDDELARLLAGARALLMPSFAEGFGLPLIEALEIGTPVIASDLPVFREIAGDIPTYLPSWDGVGWERTIGEFVGNPPERQRQLARLPGYRAPDWDEHFRAVDALLAEVLAA
jgi:glycosyltransferase involved in cell wall biosynthesis